MGISSNQVRYEDISSYEQFGTWLAQYSLLDLGIITAMNGNRASVQTFRIAKGERIIWDNVEVLYVGGADSTFGTAASGSLCLLFRPHTAVVDCTTRKVSYGAQPYDKSGMKCLPLSTGLATTMQAGFDSSGSYAIRGKDYAWTFSPSGFSLIVGGTVVMSSIDGGLQVGTNTDTKGSNISIYYGSDGKVYQIITRIDGTTTLYHTPKSDVKDPMNPGAKKDWKTMMTLTDSDIKLEYGEKTQVSVGSSGITIQDENGCKIETSSTSIKINGHLEVKK